MAEKSKVMGEFLDMLNKQNCNQVNEDSELDELFGKGKLFSVVCNKCGSVNIEIISERGIDYGGEDGYQFGSTAIKCNDCGSALKVWE